MKILLYEPGRQGHRPIILAYTEKVLDHAQISWVREKQDFHKSPWLLLKQASEAKCDIIYVLTVDGHPLFVWVLALLGRFFRIKVICTYYLFNNLTEGWRAKVWRFIITTGPVARVHVSDERVPLESHYPASVRYLPDPWDPDDFPIWDRGEARQMLSLRPQDTVFLMFGMLDERKGADLLLRAFLAMDSLGYSDEIVFLLAGTVSTSLRTLIAECAHRGRRNIKLLIHEGHIPEEKVSAYYCATDYLVCAYPGYFKVASNTVTRAFAAGRPVIVPNHGVNAATVENRECGFLFQTESEESLIGALRNAIDCRLHNPHRYFSLSKNALEVSRSRRLPVYGEYLLKSFASCVPKYSRDQDSAFPDLK